MQAAVLKGWEKSPESCQGHLLHCRDPERFRKIGWDSWISD
jgi:hypothetical protein